MLPWLWVVLIGVFCLHFRDACGDLKHLRETSTPDDKFDLRAVTDELLAKHDNNRRSLQVIVNNGPSSCNVTLYDQWKQQRYVGPLSSDTNFWIYQSQPQIVLTNGLALELVIIFCKRQFYHLITYKAGRMGPVSIQDSYGAMCGSYCQQSDILHQNAMSVSGCNCVELSTQPNEEAYTREGDWCDNNSGRLLCSMLGYCGVWGCDLSDFMCPRYEWNKKLIPYLGLGICTTSSATSTVRPPSSAASFALLSAVFISWWWLQDI